MGFFNKLANFFKGKGFREEEEKVERKPIEVENNQIYKIKQEPERSLEKIEEVKKQIVEKSNDKEPIIRTVEKSEGPIEKEQRIYNNMIKRSPNKERFNKKTDTEKVNNVDISNIDNNIANVRGIYTQLFTNNAKISDPQILDILYRNRDELKSRFAVEYIYYENGMEVARVSLSEVLPEEAKIMDEEVGVPGMYNSQELVLAINNGINLIRESTSGVILNSITYSQNAISKMESKGTITLTDRIIDSSFA